MENYGTRVPQFFPFSTLAPQCGKQILCGISVVTVWNQIVELSWNLCGTATIKGKYKLRHYVEFVWNMKVPQCGKFGFHYVEVMWNIEFHNVEH